MSKNQVSPAKSFWPSIAHWLENLCLQDSMYNQQVAVHKWYDAFLLSPDADDLELRGELMVQRNNLIDLFTVLESYPQGQRKQELLKYTAHA